MRQCFSILCNDIGTQFSKSLAVLTLCRPNAQATRECQFLPAAPLGPGPQKVALLGCEWCGRHAALDKVIARDRRARRGKSDDFGLIPAVRFRLQPNRLWPRRAVARRASPAHIQKPKRANGLGQKTLNGFGPILSGASHAASRLEMTRKISPASTLSAP